jgi:protein-S-isoprenylcysteine O-methyltransferase Ste14
MRPLHIAYSLIGCFFIAERLLRQGEGARSLQQGPADRGSTRTIGVAFGVALLSLLVAPFLNRRRIGYLGKKKWAWGGIAGMVIGLGLRIWALRVLGSFFTRTLRTEAEQHLIREGPYRLIRHPGYLGDLLLWIGAGIASSNWITIISTSLPMMGAYWYRIRVEEEMLETVFPQEYQSYARHTSKLIPFIY